VTAAHHSLQLCPFWCMQTLSHAPTPCVLSRSWLLDRVMQDAPCDFKLFADQQKQSRTDTTTNPSANTAGAAAAAAGNAYGSFSTGYQEQAYAPPQQQQQQYGGPGSAAAAAGDAEGPATPQCNCGEPASMKTSRWGPHTCLLILLGQYCSCSGTASLQSGCLRTSAH
jgi:hypothetical protein